MQIAIHNHFRNSEKIGDKTNLYQLLKKYYKSNGVLIANRMPMTFIVKETKDSKFKKFRMYIKNHPEGINETTKKNLKMFGL